ncbi:uncharacterized protein LOC110737631 [Chenopodium quinoa]|uniref:uncharacterized protein LOC110737631 n=1 Tax=Chenopodium quinoa TaxID=63459 RepID=UPI000B7707E7|nr:uncharacterized protein LOC110737631 [Chenopodium quinoa]
MIIKRGIPETFKGVVSDEVTSAKDFLAEIEKRFAKSDKAEISMLLNSLTSKEYKGKGNIRDYIMKISHIVSYNFQKEKWSLNELISFCVQEEERLKQNKTESAHLASTSKDKGKKRKSSVAKNEVANGSKQKKQKDVSYLDKLGYSCSFGNSQVTLSLNKSIVGTGSFVAYDILYMLDTIVSYHESLNVESRDFNTCVECIKGKQTIHKKSSAYRATNVLELIHTDICGPFTTPFWNGQQYFVFFIDDYSRYEYLFLILEKSQVLDVIKSYKAEVENQLNQRIKNVKSDHGGELLR